MSLFQKIFGGGTSRNGRTGRRLCIIDASSLDGPAGQNRAASPRDQINVLRRLSRFAEKEKIRVLAVLAGDPLRKVGHGEKFDDLKVYFADKAEKLPDLVLKLLRQNGRSNDVMVISANPSLEKKVLQGGGEVMRSSTFRKALEGTGGGPSDLRRSSRRSRPPRKPSGPRPKKQNGGQNKSGDDLRDLIDLVE